MAEKTEEMPEHAVEVGQAVPCAPKGMRYVGYCRSCHDFVELGPTFTCMKGGHPKDAIGVALLLKKDDPLPHMPCINWGALVMPVLWGPLHGQVFTVLLYPAWLFLDNMIYAAVHGEANPILPVLAGLLLLAFTLLYALRANEVGYLRVAAEKTLDEYVARERFWSVILVLIGVAFVVFASWYNIAIRPGL